MSLTNLPPRILATAEAESWIERLRAVHGPLMFHQSGGCCDGSAPMCFVDGEFRVGGQDVLLGRLIHGTPVWIGAAQFEYWRHTQVTIDVVPAKLKHLILACCVFTTSTFAFSDCCLAHF